MRTVDIGISKDATDDLVREIQDLDGIVSLTVHRGASMKPQGDQVSVVLTNKTLHELVRILDTREVGASEASSYNTSDPMSVVAATGVEDVVHDTNESTWEEMELTMAREANMGFNGVTIMIVSGVLAIIGFSTNALHLVIAAMLIAPGFEPIVRLSMGIIARSSSWKRGLFHTAKGYAALIVGAVATTLLFRAFGQSPLVGESSYIEPGELLSYFLEIEGSSIVIAAVAGAAGTILIATNRAVLTGGVMVALSLVPAAAIGGSALVLGEFSVAATAGLRWLIDVVMVGLSSAATLGWKRLRVQKRAMRF